MADLSSLSADQLAETVTGAMVAGHGPGLAPAALAELVRRLNTAEDALAVYEHGVGAIRLALEAGKTDHIRVLAAKELADRLPPTDGGDTESVRLFMDVARLYTRKRSPNYTT